MTDILLKCHDFDFQTDLQQQIVRFIGGTDCLAQSPDIIVTDDEEFYAQSRQKYPAVPMVLMAANSDLTTDNLNIVIKKPFRLMQLLDVLRTANNRLTHSDDGHLRFGNYELRPNKKEIEDLKAGKIIKLTEKEVDIIKYLYKNADSFVKKTDLQTGVWQYSSEVTTHTIETHIYRLRQKVEIGENRLIISNDGYYKLNMDD